jgi:hypothetical protein
MEATIRQTRKNRNKVDWWARQVRLVATRSRVCWPPVIIDKCSWGVGDRLKEERYLSIFGGTVITPRVCGECRTEHKGTTTSRGIGFGSTSVGEGDSGRVVTTGRKETDIRFEIQAGRDEL